MCVCVCACVCMCVSMHMCVHTHTCSLACVCTSVRTHMCLRECVCSLCACVCAHRHACVCLSVCVCVCVHVYVHIHAFVYVLARTSVCTHMCLRECACVQSVRVCAWGGWAERLRLIKDPSLPSSLCVNDFQQRDQQAGGLSSPSISRVRSLWSLNKTH